MTPENWLALKDHVDEKVKALTDGSQGIDWAMKYQSYRDVQKKIYQLESDSAVKSLFEAGY